MSSEVDTSQDISGFRVSRRFLDSARNDKSNKAAGCFFTTLTLYDDVIAYSAAMNMAIDEALLEYATEPIIRFYRWRSPALSFGYFGRFAHVASYQGTRDLVRRWTGGGIVFHGQDLTYSIVIPANDAAFNKSSMSIYEKIHRALCNVLVATGERPELKPVAAVSDCRIHLDSAVRHRRYSSTATHDAGYSCFENPVRADVMINGRKVAGAAQRRTRRGLLHQGSIQAVDLENDLAQRFTQALSADHAERKLHGEILKRGRELTEQKYGTENWLRKR
jgi:lipoate-protein ligase A